MEEEADMSSNELLRVVDDCLEQAASYNQAGEGQKAAHFVQRAQEELGRVHATGAVLDPRRLAEAVGRLAEQRHLCTSQKPARPPRPPPAPASSTTSQPNEDAAAVAFTAPETQSFLVSQEGEFIRELSKSESLTVQRLEAEVTDDDDDGTTTTTATTVVTCGAWSAALVEDIPVLKAGPRFFIFTNVAGGDGSDISETSCIGVMLHGLDETGLRVFEQLMEDASNLCRLHVNTEHNITEIESTRPLVETDESAVIAAGAASSWDDVVIRGIERGTASVAQALETTATAGGRLMRSAGTAIRSRLAPLEKEVEVSDRTKRVVKGFGYAARVSFQGVSFAVKTAIGLAESAVNHVAPIISSRLSSDSGQSESKKKWVRVIKAGGMGAITVLDNMERATETLVNTLSEETRETVKHRYGQEAHDVARTSLNAVGQVAQVYKLSGNLRYKALARHAAKKTVTRVVVDMHKDEEGRTVVDDVEPTPVGEDGERATATTTATSTAPTTATTTTPTTATTTATTTASTTATTTATTTETTAASSQGTH